MFFECLYRSRMYVARETNLQRYPLVENVSGERTHAGNVSIFDFHVLDEPCCMAYPMSTTPLDCLPDGFFAEAFARVNRDIEVFPLDVMERIHMLLGRISTLLARKIESDYSVRPKSHS